MANESLTLEGVVSALLRTRQATLSDVWNLGFADVRRAARLLSSQKPAAPSRNDLDALMSAFPDTTKEPDNG